jgi:hypothetical protein
MLQVPPVGILPKVTGDAKPTLSLAENKYHTSSGVMVSLLLC